MQFASQPQCMPSSSAFHNAEKTFEILQLNEDESLVEYRKAALGEYKRLLKEYVLAKTATNH